MALRQTKSPTVLSQVSSPSVTAIRMVSTLLLSSHQETSLLTHGEAAASGDAKTIRKRDCDSACSMDGHRVGVADNEVSSRKTRSARRRYQGLPSRCMTDCSAAAIGLSWAWLYETKAS